MTKFYLRLIQIFGFVFCLLIFPSSIIAQTPVKAQIVSAKAFLRATAAGVNQWQIEIRFDTQFDTSQDSASLLNISNYSVFDFDSAQPVIITNVRPVITINSSGSRVILTVSPANPLQVNGSYHLYAFNLTFGGSPLDPQAKLESPIAVVNPAPLPPNQPDPKPEVTIAKSKNRDDSNIYGAYEVTKSKNEATTGTGDIKVAIPFSKNFWKRRSTFSPVVDIKISSNAKADPDSMKFGLDWFLPLYVSNKRNKKPYKAVDWLNSAKIEAPKNFDNVNFIWDSRFLFPSASFPWEGKHFLTYIDPFIGWEVGKNLKSPLKEAQGNGIARAYYGANLTIEVPVDNLTFFKGVGFEATYIRRHPLTRELSFKKEDSGDYTLVSYGKGPKNYASSKLIFNINDLIGPYVGFEWGRLPPNYNLVDHTWKIGIIYKSKIKR